MKTDDLFEQWGIDAELLAEVVFGDEPAELAVIGGSLADDLGTASSDVDVFVVSKRFASWPFQAVSSGLRVGELTHRRVGVHVHVIPADDVVLAGHDLMRLLNAGPVLRRLGDYTPQQLAVLHALRAGLPIAGQPGLARVQTDSACDLLPLVLALRALLSFHAFTRERDELTAAADQWSAAAANRARTEAAVDALLAVLRYANPNPKWRLQLVQRAVRHGRWPVELDATAWALFPTAGADPAESARVADACVSAALADPLIASYASDLRGDPGGDPSGDVHPDGDTGEVSGVAAARQARESAQVPG